MLKSFLSFLFSLILFFTLLPQKSYSLLSLGEEEKIGQEILQEISKNTELLLDLELQYYLNLLGKHLKKRGVNFSPFQFKFFWIKDSSFNAFSVPGGYIFINSGLLEPLESEDELASVLAHEMAHNLARHVAKRIETIKKMQISSTAATLAALILGGAKAGEIASITSTALAQTKLLSYSRQDEEEADRLGFEILLKAGYNPQAMLRLMERMIKLSNFAITLNYRYLLTHPLPEERFVYVKHLTERLAKIPIKDSYALSHDEIYFKRIKARLKALSEDPSDLLVKLREELKAKDDPYLRYTYALALGKARFFRAALEELIQALNNLPQRPYFLLDLAEMYYLMGNYSQALYWLKNFHLSEGDVLTIILQNKQKYLLARSLSEIGDLSQAYLLFEELKSDEIINQDPSYLYNFGLLCSRLDKLGEAHYYFARHFELTGDFRVAIYHYKKSLSFLPKETKMYKEAEEKVKAYEKKK